MKVEEFWQYSGSSGTGSSGEPPQAARERMRRTPREKERRKRKEGLMI
jgi:hypothetical protein